VGNFCSTTLVSRPVHLPLAPVYFALATVPQLLCTCSTPSHPVLSIIPTFRLRSGMMSSTAGSREKLLDVFYGIYRQDTQQVPARGSTANVLL
jgi:hypothetical protein